MLQPESTSGRDLDVHLPRPPTPVIRAAVARALSPNSRSRFNGDDRSNILTSAQSVDSPGPATQRRDWYFHQDGHATNQDDEDNLLATAIEASIEDGRPRATSTSDMSKSQEAPSAQQTPAFRFGEDIDDTMLRLGNEFTPLSVLDGDTLIYIGPPPKTNDQTTTEHAYIKKHFERVHIMKSSTLRSLNSSKFDKLLGPMSIRAEKRLKKLGVHTCLYTTNIKYYIDLRPPSEDEEAIILITELTCTRGILSWHLAQKKHNLARTRVMGRDSFDFQRPGLGAAPKQAPEQPPISGQPAEGDEAESSDPTNSKTALEESVELEPEYSAVRHRSALERLLHAVQGNDPKLDSAAKVWTYIALAKYFGCATHERISGWVTTWLYTLNNANFIQHNPEAVYRMGLAMESPHMVRDAFSILVGEKALLNVYGEFDGAVLHPLVKSIHGRRLELLDEDERNRIDHAASSLVLRIRTLFGQLTRTGMQWLMRSREYQHLASLGPRSTPEFNQIEGTKKLVADFVLGRIYSVLCEELSKDADDFDKKLSSAETFHPGLPASFFETYNRLNQPIRLFTRTFWMSLQRQTFYHGYANTSPTIDNGGRLSHLTDAMLAAYEIDPDNGIRHVTLEAVRLAIAKVNLIVQSHWEEDETSEIQAHRPVRSGNQAARTGRNYMPMVLPAQSSPKRNISFNSTMPATDKRRKLSDLVNLPFGPWRSQQEPAVATQTSAVQDDLVIRPDHDHEFGFATGSSRVSDSAQYVWRGPAGGVKYGSDPVTGKVEKVVHPALDRSVDHVLEGDDLEQVQSTWVSLSKEYAESPASRSEALRTTGQDPDLDNARLLINQDETRRAQNLYHSRVDPEMMLSEIGRELNSRLNDILYPRHLFHGTDGVPIDLIDHLLCLDEDEWNYLPLWAGGLDDGSGGVFDEAHVPNSEAGGFRGGKRGISNRSNRLGPTASSEAGSWASGSESSWNDVASEAVSTVGGASKHATDGTETVKSISDASSEGFMRQDEIYEQIRNMNIAQNLSDEKGTSKVGMPESAGAGVLHDEDDGDGDGDVSTVMGAGSDIQGDLFHDIDDDDEILGDEDDIREDGEGNDYDEVRMAAGKVSTWDNDDNDDDDDDMEIIDKEKL